jgi:hypothetical protein
MSGQTFKVGDKVQAFNHTPGVISYGPAKSAFGRYDMYGVTEADGTERVFQSGDLKAAPVLPTFTVGDVVTLRTRAGARATVEYGPFDDRDVYVVRLVDAPDGDDNPRTFTALADVMERVPALVPVGTRVRIVRAKWAEETHGKIGVVASNTDDWRADDDDLHPYTVRLGNTNTVHVAELTPVDEPDQAWAYDGVTYAPDVDYTDNDGDPWRFAVVAGELRGDYGNSRFTADGMAYRISEAYEAYGPFTRD